MWEEEKSLRDIENAKRERERAKKDAEAVKALVRQDQEERRRKAEVLSFPTKTQGQIFLFLESSEIF